MTELSEKIKLLVCYPVIGLEFESAEKEYLSILSDLKYKMPSEDDIVSDLLNQISANEIRVTILLNQISSLKNSLAKLQLINSGRINLVGFYICLFFCIYFNLLTLFQQVEINVIKKDKND